MSWDGMVGLVRLRTNGPSGGGPVPGEPRPGMGGNWPNADQIRRLSGLGTRRDVGGRSKRIDSLW